MILDDVAGQRLPRRAPVRWGELRVGDTIRCPHDGLLEGVVGVEFDRLGRVRVTFGADDICGRVEHHAHVRPQSDVAPAVLPEEG